MDRRPHLSVIHCDREPLQGIRLRDDVATVRRVTRALPVGVALVALVALALCGCSKAEAELPPAPVVVTPLVPLEGGSFICRCEPLPDLGVTPKVRRAGP